MIRILDFVVKKQSIPVVPYNAEQANILSYEPFILLLHQLGFHLPVDAGTLFVRVPEFWTADFLFSVAEKLGPIDKGKYSTFFPHVHINYELFDFLRRFCFFSFSCSRLAALKFDVNELRGKSVQPIMHASINHEDEIDNNGDVLMTNVDSNIALPTNILNTSSILK